jgi:CelD/BcsL family acetyltransferase involved in cellulose biosynthesis
VTPSALPALRATSVRTISTIEAFDALGDEWDGLVRAMPRPSPFLMHGWLAEWWRHFGAGAQMAVHAAFSDEDLIGALPLVLRRRAGLRVASFMGGPLAVLPDLILAPGADPSVADALVGRLEAGGCDVADLYGLSENSRVAGALGSRLELIQRVEAPVLDLSAGWDAVYAEKTTGKKRNLHRRRRRQLGELGTVSVSIARTLDELEPALEEAFRLHALRWAGRPDGSGFASPAGKPFHRAALRRLAAIDLPRIVTLRIDGRAVAFHYWFALEGTMYVHRLAFDPELSRWSPGMVNTLDAVQAAAEEGLTRVEFLGGGERYKLELADGLAPLYHGFGVTCGLRGRAFAAAHLTAVRTRLRLKRSPRLHRLYVDQLAPARRVAQRVSARIPPRRGGH